MTEQPDDYPVIDLSCNKFEPDEELRFQRAIRWWHPSDHRPDLGPCLIYLGADNGNGYGQFRYNRRNGYAHRYAWERDRGPIPNDLTVDHLCRVRRCVNITHLELVPRVENYLRGVRTRTHCPNGHEYTPENLFVKPDRPGVRFCRICKVETGRRGWERKTIAYLGRPDARIKYDQEQRDHLIIEAVERRLTVVEAAERLGCSRKYMDKLVRREARARGITDRKAE